jgi:hypothetical protein
MSFTKTQTAYALLIVCASARLLLQMAALPPYAGLDEVYHVARLAFVRTMHRNPTTTEPSIPAYLAVTIENSVHFGWMKDIKTPGHPSFYLPSLPSMAEVGGKWPELVAERGGHVIVDRPLNRRDFEFQSQNYEAQQTSLYYSLAAPLVPIRSALFELRVWRAMSLLFALITVFATAGIGRRWFGPIGILGGAILVSLPTWETLVMRAGNDASACMLAAIAVLISVCAPKRALGIAAEAIVWGLALNAKMYTWPLLIILPILWWRQRATKSRVIAVTIVAAIAILLTFAELSSRTRNPLGVVAFDRPGGVVYEARVNISEIVRVTIASFAWTSGQFNDALRPMAIALYLGPILIAVLVAKRSKQPVQLALAALGAFALAQTYNVIACVLANHGGNPIPIGGKEGWYWYVLAPVLVPALLVPAVKRWRAITWWIVIWDIVITEVALFHDFAGMTSPAHGSMLFRWGPLHLPFTASLDGIGVGPLAAWTTAIRVVHLIAFFGLESFLQHMRSNDGNLDVADAR